ncbi:MAG TPA: hypothetical protein VGB37_01135 [Candidatus Lokiarchaeia archaeon]
MKSKIKQEANYLANQLIDMPIYKRCQKCKKALAVDKHHEDYNQPLEVIFLCKSCHKEIHLGKKVNCEEELKSREILIKNKIDIGLVKLKDLLTTIK